MPAAADQAECAPDFFAQLSARQGGEEALFVDTAVYTRNRAFRLYLSSKAGKQVSGLLQ
jgi:hypothetical protein